MIKEAIQYVVGLGKAEIHDRNGQDYSDKPLHLLKEPTASALEVNTLSGVVDYLKSEFDGSGHAIVHVESPTSVLVQSQLNGDENRSEWILAKAMTPTFHFDRFYDTESFNIKLQSTFVKSEDRDIMLKIVGNIQEENVHTHGDDGVSQKVVARTGVANVGNVEVPNPVNIAPYRTFTEVEQPQSDFVFRMKSGPECALFEADGGAWKLEAISNIAVYLGVELKKEIESGRITIIA
ncbi:hypothetical protein [Virgibacillus litoralis]|uniref:Phage portal protein n=1 Tax=Virgibacillus litoralis TaxID=578221 RepID=A0ABS4HH60_9BACI|nr:hypothetical protein [Virgibacillus litoralis]MBP1950257.1 hypothetical protein [Virgibacillus litoralis]